MEPIPFNDPRPFASDISQRGRQLVIHPATGVWIQRQSTGDLGGLCRAIQDVLAPNAVFTHWTGAALMEWWLPDIGYVPVIASTSRDSPHHDRRGVYIRRCDVPAKFRRVVDGIKIASPEWLIVELAETLSLLDLVAVIDSALHFGHTAVKALCDAVRPGRRGVCVLRQALELCDGRSESWWESILRVLHQLCGIPVEPQVNLFDAYGNHLGRADLHIIGTSRVSEYDGADHRAKARHRDDLRREKTFSRSGIERYGYTAIEVHRHPGMIIADAEDALGWRHDASRLEPWHAEYERSSLSDLGRRELIGRMQRFDRTASPRAAGTSRAAGFSSGAASA